MAQFENSKVVKYILNKLIDISSRKTSHGTAVMTIDRSLKNLIEKYEFLKHVEIKNTQYSEDDNTITVMSDIDKIDTDKMGKALYAVIQTMNRSLGKNAGHFFIKELRSNIDDDYHSYIRDMGIDLSLMQLEFEVEELEKKMNEES